MYENRDYDDLANEKTRLEEIMSLLFQAKDLLCGANFTGMNTLQNYIEDAISEAADCKSDIDEAMTDKAHEEEAEEIREYWRSVI